MNVVSIYGGEIQPFTEDYGYSIDLQTTASMLNCVAGIAGSIYLGKLLDKKRNYKAQQIMIGLAVALCILLTFLGLHFQLPQGIVILIIIITGAPMSAVSVISYQFAAEVIYPIGEIQGVSLMNVVNKLLSFGMVQVSSRMTDEKPDHIKYAYGFILWFVLPLIGLIPALFVNEDLRRLNMKDVEKSVYFEEKVLLSHTREVRRTIMGRHKMMASPAMLYQLDLSDLYHSL